MFSANERGTKDLVFNGECWENSNKDRLAFLSDWKCFSICCIW